MSVSKRAFSALGKLGIIVAIVIAFLIGLLGTIYYSLRSREVNVPNVVGKDVLEGERALDQDGLNMRRRAWRYSPDAKPNTILDQSPHAGEIIKVGQTVAVVVSRASAKEGDENLPNSSAETTGSEEKNTNEEPSAPKNASENSNKDKANKNTRNKNSNNSNNSNANNKNGNRNSNNRNALAPNANNRNVNTDNANANRGTGNSNRDTNSGNRNATNNRSTNNSNANKRAPAGTTPPVNQNRNRRTP